LASSVAVDVLADLVERAPERPAILPEPRGHVDRIAHRGVDEAILRAHVAHHHLPAVDPHPQIEVRPPAPREFRTEPLQGRHHVERGLARPARVVRLAMGAFQKASTASPAYWASTASWRKTTSAISAR